jgi:hypothetical protein
VNRFIDAFEQATERLDRYIWFMSHKAANAACGMEAVDFHQIGLIKLYELCCDSRYSTKPVGEFDAIFKRSMFNQFMDLFAVSNEETAYVVQVDLTVISDQWGYNAFDEAYLRHYQEHIETLVSRDAAILLEHLLNPTPAIYRMHSIQRMRREALQSQGHNARVPQKLTHALVGNTIGFSTSKTKALIRELRMAWKQCQHNSWRLNGVTS